MHAVQPARRIKPLFAKTWKRILAETVTEDSREPACIAKKYHRPCISSERRYTAPSPRECVDRLSLALFTLQANSCYFFPAFRATTALGKRFQIRSSRLDRYKWGAGAFFLKHISELAALAFWVRHYWILVHGERLSIEEDVERTNCGILVSIENCGRRLSAKDELKIC